MWLECMIAWLTINFALSQDGCKTPNGEDGTCVSIKHCPQLLLLIEQQQLNQSTIEFLRQHQCGFERKTPKVCCKGKISWLPNNQSDHNLLPDPSQCGNVVENRLIGGDLTDLGEFHWLALIEYEQPDKSRSFLCSGALISKRYVLTAAHCISGLPLNLKWNISTVILGDYDLEEETDCVNIPFSKFCAPRPLNISVEEIIPHENFEKGKRNPKFDIGLIRLAQDVPFSDFVGPICLPISKSKRNNSYENRKTYVSRWGKSIQLANGKIPLKIDMPILNFRNCKDKCKTAGIELEVSQMCVGSQNDIDTYRGDNGGPLMVIDLDENQQFRWYGIGINSFRTSSCGTTDRPEIYTRIADYIDWILSRIRN